MTEMNQCCGLLMVTLYCSLQGRVQWKYLILYKGVDSLQHPLAGELIGQVGLDLLAQTQRVRTLGPSVSSCPPPPTLICEKGELQTGGNNKRSLCCAFTHSPLSPPSLSATRKGESSRSLVGSSLPRITKHMRLWPVRRLNKPIVPTRSAENHTTRGRQPRAC